MTPSNSNKPQDATVHLALRAASSEDIHRLIPNIRALDAEALSLLGIKDVTAHLIGAMEPSHECLAVETQEGVSGIAGIVLIAPPTHTLRPSIDALVKSSSKGGISKEYPYRVSIAEVLGDLPLPIAGIPTLKDVLNFYH